MQVSVESTGHIDRTMTGELTVERIDRAVEKRLRSIAAQTRLDGFRPGKAPFALIEKRYGTAVRQECIDKLLEEIFQQTAREQRLRVAGLPKLSLNAAVSGDRLNFVATFQVYPEIILAGLESLRITRPVANVHETDLQNMVEVIRKQHRQWKEVDRSAQDGDRVNVTFEGSVNGATLEGSKAGESLVELGAGLMPKDFEAALRGMRAGEENVASVTFPENHPVENLRGKVAQFHLQVRRVCEPSLPPLDSEFIKKFQIGDGSLDHFRTEVKSNMNRELNKAINSHLKQQVMNGLVTLHTIDVPRSLTIEEVRRLREELPQGGHSLPDNTIERQAHYRVKLRLILDEIIRQQGLHPDPARVDARLRELASTCADPTALIDHYRSNREAMQMVQAEIIEDMIVDWVLEHATVIDEVCDFNTALNTQPQPQA